MNYRFILFFFLFVGFSQASWSQTSSATDDRTTDSVTTDTGPIMQANDPNTTLYEQSKENKFEPGPGLMCLSVTLMILSFSVLIVWLLLRHQTQLRLDNEDMIRLVSIILIVSCMLLIPVIGNAFLSLANASALYSLLGTIAGYLLGKNSQSSRSGNATD
ncbi:MAG: hypothetical protein EAZ91_21650 [Cytophagales bacterium]|nr:MAG: hypothetical protein EAZ91_21650 [Cytophagales bacterium]